MIPELGIVSPEFGIIVIGPGNRLAGRVYAGIVRRGMQFLHAYRILPTTPGVVPLRILVAEIDLTVVRIEYFRRDVDQLDESLTGLLEVEGRGMELLSVDMSIGAGRLPL